jgi:hypothetical protein
VFARLVDALQQFPRLPTGPATTSLVPSRLREQHLPRPPRHARPLVELVSPAAYRRSGITV